MRHSDERRVLYTGCTAAGHTGKILPACGLMEGGVEYCNVFIFQLRERFSALQHYQSGKGRVMQQCERGGVFDALNDGLISNDYEWYTSRRRVRYGDQLQLTAADSSGFVPE